MARHARAKASYVLMSPRKVRLVLDLVRGKYCDDAVAILRATPNRAARVVEKLVRSATANAENNMGISRDGLKVAGGFADPGPSLKRIQPRAMGRAFRILRRTSHITLIVEETEPKPAARKLVRTVTKADARTRRGRAEEPAKAEKPKPAKKKATAREAAPAAAPEEKKPTVVEQEAALVQEQTAAVEPGGQAAPETVADGPQAAEESAGGANQEKGGQ